MKVTMETVEHTAKLARLKFTEEEKTAFLGAMNDVLNYAELLNELDTENIEPTSHPVPLKNALREDKVWDYTLSREDVLKNAPAEESGGFKVPKIIES